MTLTGEELQWLTEAGVIHTRQSSNGEIIDIGVNLSELAQIAFEHKNLISVASSVQTDVIGAFRTSNETVLTTSQIAKLADRPKSSVSRSLGRLVAKGKISKIQSGVYRYTG